MATRSVPWAYWPFAGWRPSPERNRNNEEVSDQMGEVALPTNDRRKEMV